MRGSTALAFATAFLVSGVAGATSGFPSEIQNHLTLSYQPPCAVCHLNGVTGLGTVTTPFGAAMRAQGCVRNSNASVDAALDALAAANTDSDGDGVSDIQELKNGTDPNTAGGTPTSTLTPYYGCGADLSFPADPSVTAGVAGALGLFALAIRARRRA